MDAGLANLVEWLSSTRRSAIHQIRKEIYLSEDRMGKDWEHFHVAGSHQKILLQR
jgi:hypothetical protein